MVRSVEDLKVEKGWAVKVRSGVIYLSTVRIEKEESIKAALSHFNYAVPPSGPSLFDYKQFINEILLYGSKKRLLYDSVEKTWEHLRGRWNLECVPVEIRVVEMADEM